MPGRDRADDKGETVGRDTSGRVVVFQEACGKVFGDCSGLVNEGVVSVGDGFRVELIETSCVPTVAPWYSGCR